MANTDATKQTEQMDERQVQNSAGGYVFAVDDQTRLRRFLCLGADAGSYYANERQLKIENAQCVANMIAAGRSDAVVGEILAFSEGGRAAKQDTTIFALAMVARLGKTPAERKLAFEALPRVCRIPTHLFSFIANCENLVSSSSGWGRMMRQAIARWYNSKKGKGLALAITKYPQRNGWSHRDVLRLAHVKPNNRMHQLLLRYAVKGWDAVQDDVSEIAEWVDESEFDEENQQTVSFLKAVEDVKKAGEECAVNLIVEHGLVREHLPTEMLSSALVWAALLTDMPMTALMRNLNKLTQVGLLAENAPAVESVSARFADVEQLRAAKVHPLDVLVAMRTYAQGHGDKGKLVWTPNRHIVAALERAFYASFALVAPTGKRFVLGIDVSGSMSFSKIGGMNISCAEAATAMAMVAVRTEPMCRTMAFGNRFHALDLKAADSLDVAIQKCSNLPFGSTDCALPMLWAMQNKVAADVFVVYTDSETYAGNVHPVQALQQYRQKLGIAAKLIIVGMDSNGFSLADPEDSGMMDVVGFDAAAPEVMRGFAADEL